MIQISDEEIKLEANEYIQTIVDENEWPNAEEDFIAGAKWMRDKINQILINNKNKEK